MDQVNFLKVRFNRMPIGEATEVVLTQILARKVSKIYYANAHTMVTADKNELLSKALHHSDLLLADGSGVLWGSRLLGVPLTYNLNGTDLVPALCRIGSAKGLSVYLLGAKPNVANEAAAKLSATYPGLRIVGTQHGYFDRSNIDEVLDNIRNANPHLLLVAMGVPLQEIWIDQYASSLPGIACMGVGGLFDFMSQRVPRAPLWLRKIGMEWLWRLIVEPRRLWKRYTIGNLLFCALLLRHVLLGDLLRNMIPTVLIPRQTQTDKQS